MRTATSGSDQGARQAASLDAACALRPVEDGRFVVDLSPHWWLSSTAYGGYLAALALTAMTAELHSEAQHPLSLSIQYGGRAELGSAEIVVFRDTTGASNSNLSARVLQDGRCVASAMACFGRTRLGPAVFADTMPGVPSADQCVPKDVRAEVRKKYPLAGRFDRRPVPSAAISDHRYATWIRLAEAASDLPTAAAALLDACIPAISAYTGQLTRMMTLSYFLYFTDTLNEVPESDFLLAVFRGSFADNGYAEDDGELWSPDGRLLARSKQVVLIAT